MQQILDAIMSGDRSAETYQNLELPSTYRGITVPGFPNFFMTYGPGTHLAHGGSLILNSELQMRYINQCLEHLITNGLKTMEPRPEPSRTTRMG